MSILEFATLLWEFWQIILRLFDSDEESYRRDSAAFDMTLTQDSVERPLDAGVLTKPVRLAIEFCVFLYYSVGSSPRGRSTCRILRAANQWVWCFGLVTQTAKPLTLRF